MIESYLDWMTEEDIDCLAHERTPEQQERVKYLGLCIKQSLRQPNRREAFRELAYPEIVRQEQEKRIYQELSTKYRHQYKINILSDEGEKWLKENDTSWWESEMQKQQILTGQELLQLKQVVKQALAEPVETLEQRQERLINLAEEKGLLLPEQPKSRQQEIQEWLQQKHNGDDNLESKLPVKVYYQGKLPEGSIEIVIFDGRRVPVYPNVIYTISAQVYENLQQPQSQFRVGDWMLVSE